ncbi:MAG: hypothetical protein ACREBG_27980 [Pyrinomonadaceae bacterium]
MSKQFVRLLQHRGRTRKGDTRELANQLAPLEEQARQKQSVESQTSKKGAANVEPGAIVVDNDNLIIAKDIAEGPGGKNLLGIEPVVLVILGVVLAFVAFIAWQISKMPPQ